MTRLLVIGLLISALVSPFATLAQTKASPQAVVAPDDRSPVRVRYPAPDRLRALQTNRDYQYGSDAPPPENPLARLWAWVWRKISEFLSSKAYQNVWQYVVLAIVAGVFIYLLLKAEVLGFLFPKRAQSSPLGYENQQENIHAINFDVAIDEAVSQRNYRLAMRLRYLQTLKTLSLHNAINWQVDKTNWQYVNELKGGKLEEEFTTLTKTFERIWYGDFPIDERIYNEAVKDYYLMDYAMANGAYFGK